MRGQGRWHCCDESFWRRPARGLWLGGVTTDKMFEFVDRLREKTNIPLVFMTYANVVFSYGTERFVKKSEELGIDGLILPDVPFKEKGEFDQICKAYNSGFHFTDRSYFQ